MQPFPQWRSEQGPFRLHVPYLRWDAGKECHLIQLFLYFYILHLLFLSPSLLLSLSQVERQSRKLFLWKIEVHDQKERVYEMRTYNEALVTNMLPEHVAKHFLGSKKRDEVRDTRPQHLTDHNP